MSLLFADLLQHFIFMIDYHWLSWLQVKCEARGSPFHTPRTSPRDPFKPPPFGLGGAVNAPHFALPLQQSTARQYFLSPTAKAQQRFRDTWDLSFRNDSAIVILYRNFSACESSG